MLRDLLVYSELAFQGIFQMMILSAWLLVMYILPIAFLIYLWMQGYQVLALVINLFILVPFWIYMDSKEVISKLY